MNAPQLIKALGYSKDDADEIREEAALNLLDEQVAELETYRKVALEEAEFYRGQIEKISLPFVNQGRQDAAVNLERYLGAVAVAKKYNRAISALKAI